MSDVTEAPAPAEPEEKEGGFQFPSTMTVLILVTLLVWIAAFLIPSGTYQVDENGVPEPGSYQEIDSPQDFGERVGDFFLAPVNGLYGLQNAETGTVEPFQQTPALGSGVIFRSDGYILTNHHVVDGGEAIQVRLASGEVLEAEVIGTDELNDLAVVRVDQNGLPAIQQRPADEPIIVGEQVVAIGSPFGLDASVTTGIVSALNREIHLDEPDEEGNRQTITAVIQTDAAINPGNSGGALVDSQGRLIGINTAILTRTGASQGVGFAVSAEQAVSSGDQLIEHGFVRHPLLGIAGYDVNPDVAEEFELPSSQGAIIESVQEGTGADDAGLRSGDIIVEVDGEQLATMAQLVAEVRRRAPGETIELVILRDGETITFDIELGERPR
jgi:S1-C subfamily serine protease